MASELNPLGLLGIEFTEFASLIPILCTKSLSTLVFHC